jgi:formamidopyrimidine-DNA glycosylase
MPELPEAETIARTLSPLITGKRITQAKALHKAVQSGPYTLDCVVGRRIFGTSRRGKLVLVNFTASTDKDKYPEITGLAFHLKMTGRLFCHTEENRHTRASFSFDDGSHLFFDDMRTFGYVRVLSPASLASWEFWKKLGPEPLEICSRDFAQNLREHKGKIKAVLLDQRVIAGIGNIYADESLFLAGIRPDAAANALSMDRLILLHEKLKEVLLESIAACGSSIDTYRTARGDAGSFQNKFKAYGRGGQPCLVCGHSMEKIRWAGRGTVFCPFCQTR